MWVIVQSISKFVRGNSSNLINNQFRDEGKGSTPPLFVIFKKPCDIENSGLF